MTKNPMLPSVFACATLVFTGAGLATAAHAHNSPPPGQSASPQAAPSQNENRRTWTPTTTSAHSSTNGRFMSTAMGGSMGAKGGKMQKCSQKAFARGLWGKARKRFINKCLKTHSWTDSRSMGTAMGAPMGAKADSRARKCSQKASARELWGKARKRFMEKCLKMS